jgi:hypothetical protein
MSKSKSKSVQQPQAATAFPTSKPVDPIVAPASAITSDASTAAKASAKKAPKKQAPKKSAKDKPQAASLRWPFPQGQQSGPDVTPQPQAKKEKKQQAKQLKQQAKAVKAAAKKTAVLPLFAPVPITPQDVTNSDNLVTSLTLLEVVLPTGKKAKLWGYKAYMAGRSPSESSSLRYLLLDPKDMGPLNLAVTADQVRVCERKTRDAHAAIRREMRAEVSITPEQIKALLKA